MSLQILMVRQSTQAQLHQVVPIKFVSSDLESLLMPTQMFKLLLDSLGTPDSLQLKESQFLSFSPQIQTKPKQCLFHLQFICQCQSL